MIKLSDVHKSFGANRVLTGVDLTLDRGKSTAIIGASGSGKTILAKCLLGLIPIDHGQIIVPDMSDIGVLFQGGALFDSLSIWENVAFRPLQDKMDRQAARRLAEQKLERVGLPVQVAELRPAELSGGMQKRAALARAIAYEPKFLLFDEPTAGLDPVRARQISQLIRSIVSEANGTALTITHDIPNTQVIADDVAYLRDGQIYWQGPVEHLGSGTNAILDGFIKGEMPSLRWTC